VSNLSKWLVTALCAWTVFVWGNRISNAWSSTTESTSAKAISTVLAASFLVLAVGGVVILARSWAAPLTNLAKNFLLVFAGWTVLVWCIRIVGIVLADHEVGFKVVHTMLGLISIALAVGVARAVRRTPAEAISPSL
jgi:hypothetical protein